MRRVTTRRHRARRPAAARPPALLLLVVLGMLVSACAGGEGDATDRDSAYSGTPVPGGRLVYGISADADGFNPTRDPFAAQTFTMVGTIIETLTAIDASGMWRPMLAKSVEPADNAQQWTIKLRDGITFSTGDPLDAEVVRANLEAQRISPQNAAVLAPVKSIEVVDNSTVRVQLAMPWVSFPYYLAGQIGMMVPQSAFANADRASRRPVGTGPFILDQYVPGSRFVVKKNPRYWRKGLPYLDEVEFRILPDTQTRTQTLESGGLDAMVTTNDRDVVKFGELAKQGRYQVLRATGMSVPEFSFMLNTAAPPLDDLRVRQALAHATDRQAFITTLRSGLTQPADGPWSKDSPWYSPGAYPSYDLDRAKALVQQYTSDKGPINIELMSVPDSLSMQNAELVQGMWRKAGVEVTIKQVDQAEIIRRALTGDYDAAVWVQFSAPDPDGEYVWWHSAYAAPIGGIAINMSRIRDAELDNALNEGRSNADETARKRAYATVQQRLRELVPFIWIDHLNVGAVIADAKVHGLTDYKLPDGEKGRPLFGSPVPSHPFAEAWVVSG